MEDPYMLLGLDNTYNKNDAIDAYNTLLIYFNNLDIPMEEKSIAIQTINYAINTIKNNDDKSIDKFSITKFNKIFEEQTYTELNLIDNITKRFGYFEKII